MTELHTDPFISSLAARPLGDGTHTADLAPEWSVGTKPHGGYLIALLTRTAMRSLGEPELDPLSVSAHFLRAPQVGPVLLRTELMKTGRTVTLVRATLEQSARICVEATITLGRLPSDEPVWSDLPDMPVNPPAGAIDIARSESGGNFPFARSCELRLDPKGAGFLAGTTTDPPRLRLWARPRSTQPDPLFALIAGDLTVPVTFNLGRFGWAPTVQLTALVRARPANGWLRLAVESKAVHGRWFDEDTTVIDSTGRLVCQARQLALSTPTTPTSPNSTTPKE